MTTLSAQRLAQVFIEVSDTLIDEFDLLDFLHMLTMRTAELSAASVVGLVLADKKGELRFMAASREDARLLELFQLQNDEGPCLDAFRTGTPVVNTDLRNGADRWPLFAPHATDAGFRSVHAFPLRLRTQVIGALNVFGADDGARLDADDIPLVQALADMASIALLQERTIRQAQVLAEQLQGALNSRIVIEQAKGVVAQSRGVSVDDAFTLIRGFARSNNRRLGEVARAIVANAGDLPELTGPGLAAGGDASPRPAERPTSSGAAQSYDTETHDPRDISIRRRLLLGGELSLEVSGDVDTDSTGQLNAAIQGAIGEADVTKLVVNLDRVKFLDSSGIRTLLDGLHGAAEHGVRFRVVNPNLLVRHVLEVTGVLAMLTDGTSPDLPGATRARDTG